jgi:hypothetical protein
MFIIVNIMAFTDAQKSKVIGHLGYTVDSWSLGYIGGKLDAIANLSADSETRVGAIITQLDTLETQLNSSIAANAGIQVKSDGTVFYQGQSISEINNQYNYWKNKLSIALGVSMFSAGSRVVRS